MTTPDLHISITYLSTPAIQRIGLSLRSDPFDDAPGWFLRAYRNEGYHDVVKYTRIPDDLVDEIASVVDEELQLGLLPAVQTAIAEAAAAREQQIKTLRQRIAADKKMLEVLEESKPS